MFNEYGFSLDALKYDFFYILIYLMPIWWFGNNGKQWDISPGLKKQESNG